MGFSSKHKLKFTPEDEVMKIYLAIYRGKTPIADSMECESFLMNIEATFALPVPDMLSAWRDNITLGELFSRAAAQQGAQDRRAEDSARLS